MLTYDPATNLFTVDPGCSWQVPDGQSFPASNGPNVLAHEVHAAYIFVTPATVQSNDLANVLIVVTDSGPPQTHTGAVPEDQIASFVGEFLNGIVEF